jgi:TatD DNase family protein
MFGDTMSSAGDSTVQMPPLTQNGFVDVHAHIFHADFAGEEDDIATRALQAGVEVIIVNGLEPASNRAVLELCQKHVNLLPALGIYPVDAVANTIDTQSWDHPFPPPKPFDVDEEVDFISSVADQLVAVGECGLDGYWIKDQMAEQERVLRRLCEVAMQHDLPVILHTRKAEQRTFEILLEMGVEKADFHCFGGKIKLAKRIAEAGYYLSIPPVVERSEAFQRMSAALPMERLLTETDCPYMGPDRGERNEPANVPRGVAAIAKARDEDPELVRQQIRENARRLFGV